MSTSLPSATPRGTPGLAVPASQNTAPVIKFRCLYTHDLRRKAKRWQDGYLRYHTFNKRVMVYDITGNFIGDLHWRQDEGVQDGDEMELDKGVMIQVGECMEKTETDISTLFEKRRTSQGASPQAKGPSTPSVRPAPTSTPARSSMSSQPPRSLNDLLGIKRTPIGRLVSPYEERHPPGQAADNQQSERATKRLRTALEERSQGTRDDASVREEPMVIDLERPVTTVQDRGKISTLKPASESSVRRENSLPGRVAVTTAASTTRRKEKTTTPKPASESSLRHMNSQLNRTAPNMPSANSTHKEALPKPVENVQPSINKPLPPVSQPPGLSKPTPDAPINTLRMSTDRPRRKLMYSELLRNQASTQPSGQSQTNAAPEPSNPQAGPERAKSQAEDIPPDTMPTNADFMPSDSTMFVLDEMAVDPVLDQPASDSPPIKAEPTSQTDLLQTNLLPAPQQQPKIKTPSLPRRPVQPEIQPMTTTRPQTLPARASHTGLRKAYSDPTALITPRTLPPRQLPSRSPLSTTHTANGPAQGPWTSEALDLFDFWPEGRPKPG